jgi:hypothetical protein
VIGGLFAWEMWRPLPASPTQRLAFVQSLANLCFAVPLSITAIVLMIRPHQEIRWLGLLVITIPLLLHLGLLITLLLGSRRLEGKWLLTLSAFSTLATQSLFTGYGLFLLLGIALTYTPVH